MENIVQIIDKDKKELSLHLNDERLGEFISSLLGQPQSISKFFSRPFKVDHNFFKHVLSLVFQRLEQQNDFETIGFVAKISFNDGTERKINSLDSFYSYSETMNLVSTRLFISISLLIKFPSKKTPERQNINFIFDSENSFNDSNAILGSLTKSSGVIIIDIEHTERTWADDMLTMIEKSLDEVWIEEGFAYKNIMKVINLVGSKYFLTFSILLSTILMLFSLFRRSTNSYIEELDKLDIIKNVNLSLINDKLDLLSKAYIMRNDNSDLYLLMLPIFIPSLAILINLFREFIAPYLSYVVLTKNTQDFMDKNILKNSKRNKIFSTLIMLLISLMIGILGNYIYNIFIV